MLDFFILVASLILLIKGADYAIKYSAKLAAGLQLSKYLIGFLLVAIISVLPETLISIASALQGRPSFGLGTLYGSNVADLTLVFAITIFVARRVVKVESKVIKNSPLYILALAIPIVLGLDGHYSRIEGISLILVGFVFYTLLLRSGTRTAVRKERHFSWPYFWLLLGSMAILLVASNLTVRSGVLLAERLDINPVLVAMLFVGLGTTLPELLFSISSVRKKHDGLALGDILGTVITDATIIVGIIAVIAPFTFNRRIVYVTGIFMIIAALLLQYFMRTGKVLTKKEGILLLFFYLLFVLTEFAVASYFQYDGA